MQSLLKIEGRLGKLEEKSTEKPASGKDSTPEHAGSASAGSPLTASSHGETGNAMSASTQDPLITAGKRLDNLLTVENASTIENNCHSNFKVFDKDRFDPRSMLTVKAKQTKAIHINQFLQEGARRRRQNYKRDIIVDTGSGCLRSEDTSHPYAHITIAEWGAANCRLMNHLLTTGLLQRTDIEFYLAYTTKIFDLAEKYEWSSILEYDYQYRELQAEHGFSWGISNPHMELQVLVPRTKLAHEQKHAQGRRKQTEQEECKLFLAHGYCRFGDKCRYKHPTKQDAPPQPSTKNGQQAPSK